MREIDKHDIEQAPELTTDESVLSELNAEDLLKTISSLPTGYRIVFNLYAIEGYSHKEIAEELGITEGSSRSQLTRARQTLIQLLHPTRNHYVA